jgi:hypothetical protein
MSVFSSPVFLRRVLFADALSCLATGAAQLLFAEALTGLLGLPTGLLVGTGIFLLAYAALVALVATRDPLPPEMVWVFVIGNAGWALGCGALLASGLLAPTALGQAWVIAQAATVVVLAELQWTCLRRQRPAADWA